MGLIMGRELKRVPMDFDYPLNKVWYGYFMNYVPNTCMSTEKRNYCEQCKEFAKIKGIEISDYGCPKFDDYFSDISEKLKELCEPPKGDGYQLWETTSEGSPASPVFETLDKLCEWCKKTLLLLETSRRAKRNGKKCFKKTSSAINKEMSYFFRI